MLARLRAIVHRAGSAAASLQGVAGVAAVSAGCYLQFGTGVALIVGGSFFLVGAWGSR